MMPLPADKESWASMNVMFATSLGGVRKNALSDFTNVKSNGKIAMKLERDGEKGSAKLVGVRACSEGQDVLLAVTSGKCIRFPVSERMQNMNERYLSSPSRNLTFRTRLDSHAARFRSCASNDFFRIRIA